MRFICIGNLYINVDHIQEVDYTPPSPKQVAWLEIRYTTTANTGEQENRKFSGAAAEEFMRQFREHREEAYALRSLELKYRDEMITNLYQRGK